MLNFFRKLRQRQLKSKPKNTPSSTGRYLKYAIGEIFLVVIGILIALSINDWSDRKKDSNFEHKMLQQIETALSADINYFNRMISRLSRLDTATQVMTDLIQQKATFLDSMYDQRVRWYGLRTGIVYNYNRGPYDALKSSGIDKISNNSLRNNLVQLYDFEFPRNQDFIDPFEREYVIQSQKLDDFQGPPFIENRNRQNQIFRKFPKDLLQRPSFLLLIDGLKTRARLEILTLEGIIPMMKSTEEMLKNELAR